MTTQRSTRTASIVLTVFLSSITLPMSAASAQNDELGADDAKALLFPDLDIPSPAEKPRSEPPGPISPSSSPPQTSLAQGTREVSTNATPADLPACEQFTKSLQLAMLRFQELRLHRLRGKIDEQSKRLDEKIVALRALKRDRELALNKVRESLVAIYSGMKPDAAAERLRGVDDDLVAALMSKLDATKAGAILAEADPDRAARITRRIAELAGAPSAKPVERPSPRQLGGTETGSLP